MSGRILVIQLAKLGDFIQSTPLLSEIRRLNPGSTLVLAGEQPAVLEAARLSPLVDEVVTIAGEDASGGPFDRVFVLNSHARAAGLAARAQAGQVFGPGLDGGRLVFTPAQQWLLALMRAGRELGRLNLVDVWLSLIPGARPTPLVWPPAGFGLESRWGDSSVSTRLSRWNITSTTTALCPSGTPPGLKLGIQLGSRNHLRRWPVEHFAGLAARLSRMRPGLSPVLLGSAEERALGLKFEKLLRDQAPEVTVHNLMGRTDLQSLGAAAAGLDLLITADTGVMHLAAAVGVPVLALFFGPAYGPETGPYGPGHLIYQALAPCAPCREGADCRLRQCREMPEPEIAARLAASLLAGTLQGDAEIGSLLPPGHKVWRTGRDTFGQCLTPVGRPPLTPNEALALLLTEAGRKVLRPDYHFEAEALKSLLQAYDSGPEAVKIDRAAITTLAGAGFPSDPRAGQSFLADTERLAASVGLEFAS